jgi:hypothetical protein
VLAAIRADTVVSVEAPPVSENWKVNVPPEPSPLVGLTEVADATVPGGIATETLLLGYRWSAAESVTLPDAVPFVKVVACPAAVAAGVADPPLVVTTVQLTGMLAENWSVAPLAKAPGLAGAIVTGGSRLTTRDAVAPPEPVAVIVAVSALFGIGFATVNVTDTFALDVEALKVPADAGFTDHVTDWLADTESSWLPGLSGLVVLGVITGGFATVVEAWLAEYRWSAAVIVTIRDPELPIVNVVCCPAPVEAALNVPPLFGVMVQFTGILAENGCVAPTASEIPLGGVRVTSGSKLTVADPDDPPESTAVIMAVRALLGIGLATVNVTFWLALEEVGLKLPTVFGDTDHDTAWFADTMNWAPGLSGLVGAPLMVGGTRIVVESVADALAEPPPDTLTEFTCGELALAPTFTVTVMAG